MRNYMLKVDEENKDLRLDIFLTKNLPDISSRNFIKNLIESNMVTVNGRQVKAHYKICPGDEIKVKIPKITTDHIEPENIPLDIFYEDEEILIVNKPVGMMVHPASGQYSGTLVNALLHHCKNLSCVNEPLRPGIVHRLDKETSGLMIVAKNNSAHVNLARQFERHAVHKRYIASVEGLVEFDEGLIDAPLTRHPRHREKKAVAFNDEAKHAETFYRVLKRFEKTTLLALFPRTGRTHQLRVHMTHLGHPILGDEKYGKKKSFGRLALHAQSIGFLHPKTSKYIEFSTKIPGEFFKVKRNII